MKNVKLIILGFILAFTAGCGGSGSGNTAVVDPSPPPPVGGIGRTGIAMGPISTFGSVVVNGVRYDTSSAVFTVNGLSGSQDDLSVGQVITVSGTIDDNGIDGDANEVNFDDNVKGPVQSIDLALSQIVVLGRRRSTIALVPLPSTASISTTSLKSVDSLTPPGVSRRLALS